LKDKNKKFLTIVGIGAAFSALAIGMYMHAKRESKNVHVSIFAKKK
jgi:multisubunit Na+/H+ antiporter MnhC subunit